jgi:type IV fimbrial biogenesis protein FimT
MRCGQRGFNLVETVVVMTLLATLTVLALPSFKSILERTRTATALNRLTATLSSARSTALMRRQTVSVCPSQDRQTCRKDGIWEDGWIVFVDDQKTGQPVGNSDILRVAEPLNASLVLRATPGRHRARFQPNGQSTGSTLTLSLCLRSGHRPLGLVILNNWGRARTVRDPAQDPTCAAAP